MTLTEEHFDAVVIGSGFGGSVMTYRLSEAGMRVCLLERGKAYPPNGFARAPYDLGKNFWDPSEGLFGLFNVWSFKRSGALVSSGLGGGSLIYANVLIRKDEAWFKDELPGGGYREWPVNYKQLETHYERVERMMNAQTYPLGYEPYSQTPKTRAMQEAATHLTSGELKGRWLPLNLAVSFRANAVASPGEDIAGNPPLIGAEINEQFPNYHSVRAGRKMARSTCRLCGECDIGCNYGSKNTLDHTYISAAINQKTPADVRTLCEVKSIRPTGEAEKRYRVEYVVHDPEQALSSAGRDYAPECMAVTCKYLVLSAGTFGTPYLLFKNAGAFPGLSPRLGERYSVNGDLLSFITKSVEKTNGKTRPRRLDPSFGPVIISAIRFGDQLDGEGETGRGFYVEDGGHPYLMGWLVEVSGLFGFFKRSAYFLKRFAKYWLGFGRDADFGAEIANLLGEAATSMSTMPILAMGRDIASGKLELKDGLLDCDWKIEQSAQYYKRLRSAGDAIATALHAKYEDNPSYKFNFRQVLTAHPLGGCSMADSIDEGVVDANCQVFGYPGLFVADGSVMPGPVGPNPSLTIAAIADRAADHLISKASMRNL